MCRDDATSIPIPIPLSVHSLTDCGTDLRQPAGRSDNFTSSLMTQLHNVCTVLFRNLRSISYVDLLSPLCIQNVLSVASVECGDWGHAGGQRKVYPLHSEEP